MRAKIFPDWKALFSLHEMLISDRVKCSRNIYEQMPRCEPSLVASVNPQWRTSVPQDKTRKCDVFLCILPVVQTANDTIRVLIIFGLRSALKSNLFAKWRLFFLTRLPRPHRQVRARRPPSGFDAQCDARPSDVLSSLPNWSTLRPLF